MANFTTVISSTDTNNDDEYLVRQGTVDRKQSRSTLSKGTSIDILNNNLLPSTETQKGTVELATQAEVNAGTDTERVLTPATFKSANATTTTRGVVELATNTEVQTGTDTARSVTPSGLSSRTATTTRTGIAEIATQTEVDAGTDSTRIVTPATLASRLSGNRKSVAIKGGTGVSSVVFTVSTSSDNPADAVLHVVMGTTIYKTAAVPLRFFYIDTTSGTLMVDDTDGTDFRFDYSYSGGNLTLTAIGSTFKRVYVEGRGS